MGFLLARPLSVSSWPVWGAGRCLLPDRGGSYSLFFYFQESRFPKTLCPGLVLPIYPPAPAQINPPFSARLLEAAGTSGISLLLTGR